MHIQLSHLYNLVFTQVSTANFFNKVVIIWTNLQSQAYASLCIPLLSYINAICLFDSILDVAPSMIIFFQQFIFICLNNIYHHGKHYRPNHTFVCQLLEMLSFFEMCQKLLVHPVYHKQQQPLNFQPIDGFPIFFFIKLKSVCILLRTIL